MGRMKRIYTGLTGLTLVATIAALLATLWMIHASPGLSPATVIQEVYGSGALTISAICAVPIAAAVGAGLWVRSTPARWMLIGVLWVAGLAAVLSAGWQALTILNRIGTVATRLGGLKFEVRAPGYADLLLMLAGGLLVLTLALAGLAYLQARARSAGRR
jgi:hypothetical protein